MTTHALFRWSASSLVRAGWLTPYDVQLMAEEARRGGRGTRLDVIVSSGDDDASLAAMRAELATLVARGVSVHVRAADGGHRRAV